MSETRIMCPSPEIDEVAIERALNGIRVKLTEQEFQFVIDVLAARGMSTGEIARRLHAGQRTIASRRRDTI